jgi:8-oxo-dGTP pyrophosphatase MutT (NUDIX family)
VTIERRAVRVLLVADGAVLLIQGHDPAKSEAAPWWHVPGGGIDEGETPAAAAVREVLEETGLRVTEADVGPVVATRVAEFDFDGRHFRQSESFYAMPVARFAPAADGWEPHEHRSLLDHRWWTADELATTSEMVYPVELATLLRAVLAGPVDPPMRLREQRS